MYKSSSNDWMIGYVKCFNNNKTMSFKVTDNNLLEKYTEI